MKSLIVILLALKIISAAAERQTTRTAITGLVQTATVTAAASGFASSSTTSLEILLPTTLPKKEELPTPLTEPEHKTIEYRFLALIALPGVVLLLFYFWTLFCRNWWRTRNWSQCICFKCRLRLPHLCMQPGGTMFEVHCFKIHHCQVCRKCQQSG